MRFLPTSSFMGRGIVLLIATVLAGCSFFEGEDGQDGEAFIAYSWIFDPIVFYTTDPYVSWSGVVLNNVYVQTEPGTYYFEYVSWDDSY